MKGGATEFLTKPFREQTLLDAVHVAIEADRKRREAEAEMRRLSTIVDKLAAPERTVFRLTAEGLTAKEIGREMNRRNSTVRWQKCLLRRKLGARTNVHLMRIGWAVLGVAA